MKHLEYFILLCILVFGFYSCSEDEFSEENKKDSDEYIYVDFNFSGDFCETESPLSRNEIHKNFYGIDIREVNTYTDIITGQEVIHTEYEPYAYGLFTSKENMRIPLKKGQKYRIYSTILQEKKDTLYHEGNKFYYPFAEKNGYVELTNKFIVKRSSNLDFDNYFISVKSKYGSTHAQMDRYYGCDEYTPTNDKNTVNLNLKRYNFGLKLVVIPPIDGSLQIKIPALKYDYTIYSYHSTYEDTQYYTTATNSKSYEKDLNYAEDINIDFYWSRSDGSTETYNKTIKVKRNVLKTLNINLNKRDYESVFEFTLDDVMTEESENIN